MAMKLGYTLNSWGGVVGTPNAVTSIGDGFYVTPGSPLEALETIAAAGFSGIELFDGNLLPYEGKMSFLRKTVESHDLEVAAVYSGGHFIYPDAHSDEVARFERSIGLAAEAGARHFVLGGGAVRSGGRAESDYSTMAELLDKISERAHMEGLKASYHPHLGSLAESPSQIDSLLAESAIGLCADVAHLAAGGADPAEVIRRYSDRLEYVHLKDLEPDTHSFVPLGKGSLDIADIVRAIVDSGYRDWITIELDGYSGDPDSAVQDNYDLLEGHLQGLLAE